MASVIRSQLYRLLDDFLTRKLKAWLEVGEGFSDVLVKDGNIEIVNVLLSSNANTLSEDAEGLVPIYRALLLGYTKVVEALLEAMECSEKGKAWIARPEVGGDLTAAAIETLPDGKVLYSAHLVQRVAKFEACRLQNSRSLLHHWAEKDYAAVFSRSCELGLHDVEVSLDMKDNKGSTLLTALSKLVAVVLPSCCWM